MANRHIRTAPLPTGDGAVNVLQEVRLYQRRLRQRSNRLENAVSDAWIEGREAKNDAGRIRAGVRGAFKEIERDGVKGELRLGQYLARKLEVTAEAGILDARLDIELAMLRVIVRKL
ncbi:MAG: hypothetical protein FJ020_03110 [Chloroflexi bacterium]|nr:hypothetical protein [Chloroflexota bacterium]